MKILLRLLLLLLLACPLAHSADPLALEYRRIREQMREEIGNIPREETPGLPEIEAQFQLRALKNYRNLAADLENQRLDFSGIFSAACARYLEADPRTRMSRKQEAANLFGGLFLWAKRGAHKNGAPLFQERPDWVLHFLFGGYLAAEFGQRAAHAAALEKEIHDSKKSDNFFDLDDFAVTLLGAYWVNLLEKEDAGHAWAAAWSQDGTRTLNDLPPYRFGQLPKGRLANENQRTNAARFSREILRQPRTFAGK